MKAGLAISRRDRRTLAGGFTVIAAALIVSKGIPAVRAWEAEQVAAAASARADIARLEAGVGTLAELRDTIRARTARLNAIDTVMLSGPSPSSVAAALASMISDIADDNRLRVGGLQLRADSTIKHGMAQAEVRVTATSDVVGLAGFLRDLESNPTPLLVRELAVSQPEPGAGDAKAEALRLDLLVATLGVIRPGAHQ
jgi:hypothetical protein